MTNQTGSLTELEGAVLSEIHHRGHRTAFQVRRAFQVSPSVEWSGSAGAVYPAIRRLIDAGLLRATAITTGRRGEALDLTEPGSAALDSWIADPVRAIGVGMDPFRLRAGLWKTLGPERRRSALIEIRSGIERDLERLRDQFATQDNVERVRTEWSILLQEMRLKWLAGQDDGS